uniref:Exosome complex component RRP45 n=1 Tax=Astyanax mexicanus TaxID=7994 RepID=A0A8B9JBC1_ASTMX
KTRKLEKNCYRKSYVWLIHMATRLDGRQTYDYRNIRITFGTDYGCCTVSLGKTRVLAQVSCELVPPKDSRPTEGIVFFNLELSPMASPAFQPNRQSELLVTLNRQLERCLRNSKCIDTESLCVVSGEKVWQIRVDVHVLNHDGNLMDAASIAAISALSHFRRPDVAIQGRDITIFSPEERDPVALSIYHMPICVSFAFFQQGTYLLVDPCEKEEQVTDGLLVIAMNKHREICSIQSSGGIMLLKDQVLRCSKIASVKVSEITDLINKALENDKRVRKEGGRFGFAESMPKERITALKRDEAPVEMTGVQEMAEEFLSKGEAAPEVVSSPVIVATGTGQLGEGVQSTWGLEEEDEEDECQGEMDKEEKKKKKAEKGTAFTFHQLFFFHFSDEVMVISDSEEEEVVVLNPEAPYVFSLFSEYSYQ